MNNSFSILETKRYHFNVSRFCVNPLLTGKQNSSLYGSDAHPHGLSVFMNLSFRKNQDLKKKISQEKQAKQERTKELSDQKREEIIDGFLNKINERCLNHEISYFKKKIPTTEYLAQYCFKALNKKFSSFTQVEGSFIKLSLEVNNRHSVCLRKKSNRLEYSVSQNYSISSLHRHFNPSYSEEKNKRIYGKCFKLHGHEYKVNVTLTGSPNFKTGLIIPKEKMNQTISRVIVRPFHKNIMNRMLGNTSGEIIVDAFYSLLRKVFDPALKLKIHLRETQKNSFQCSQF